LQNRGLILIGSYFPYLRPYFWLRCQGFYPVTTDCCIKFDSVCLSASIPPRCPERCRMSCVRRRNKYCLSPVLCSRVTILWTIEDYIGDTRWQSTRQNPISFSARAAI